MRFTTESSGLRCGRDVPVAQRLANLERKVASVAGDVLASDVLTCVGDGLRLQLPMKRRVRLWARGVTRDALETLTKQIARAEHEEVTRLERAADLRAFVFESDAAASTTVGLAWFAYCHDAFPADLEGYDALRDAVRRLDTALRFWSSPRECRELLGDQALLPSTSDWLHRVWSEEPPRVLEPYTRKED